MSRDDPAGMQLAIIALRQIESGRPAGSEESSLATDGSWREYVRELQRIARTALRIIDAPSPPPAKPQQGERTA